MSQDLIRCCLLYNLEVSFSAAASCRQIFEAFRDTIVDERTAIHWIQKFKPGDLSLDEALLAAIEEGRSLTCGKPARDFKMSNETVRLHLR